MLEKIAYLGHHPLLGGNNAAIPAGSPGAGAWILIGIFVVIISGIIYLVKKNK